MLRLLGSLKRFRIMALVTLGLTLVAAGFIFIHREQSVPRAKAAVSYNQTIDLGDGYVLRLDANGGQIVPPETVQKWTYPAVNTEVKKYDLGYGYWLIVTPDGRQTVEEGSR
jgi:hypothetical protein